MMNFVTNENLSKTMPRERITARVSHDVYATINEAAELSGTTVNSFMIQVALQHAQDLIDTAKMRSIKVMNEVEAAWFLSKFEEKFTPNTKLANVLRRYNEAINDTENPNQTI